MDVTLVKKEIRDHGLALKFVAHELGVSPTYFCKVLSGYLPLSVSLRVKITILFKKWGWTCPLVEKNISE